jgi:hypothetical protein
MDDDDETWEHLLVNCPAATGARLRWFAGQDPTQQLFDNPTAVVGFLRDVGYWADRV